MHVRHGPVNCHIVYYRGDLAKILWQNVHLAILMICLFTQAHADEAGDAKRRLERTEALVKELKSQNAAMVAKLDQILNKLGSG